MNLIIIEPRSLFQCTHFPYLDKELQECEIAEAYAFFLLPTAHLFYLTSLPVARTQMTLTPC